jgi:hypothetical protein
MISTAVGKCEVAERYMTPGFKIRSESQQVVPCFQISNKGNVSNHAEGGEKLCRL